MKAKKMLSEMINKPSVVNTKHSASHYWQTMNSLMTDVENKLNLRKSAYENLAKTMPIGTLFVQVTNICNAKCIFCAYKDLETPKGIMTFETFKKAIDDYVQIGGKTVSFTPIIGDPLIDPGLLKKIAYARSFKQIKKIYFYTNGILLSGNDKYKDIIESGVDEICVSVGDLNKDLYKKVYNVDAYTLVIDGLHKLLEYNKKAGERVSISINFRTYSPPKTIIESTDFQTYIKPYLSTKVVYEFLNNYDNWGGIIKQEHLIGIMKSRRVQRIKNIPCVRTFEPTILQDGKVRACSSRCRKTEFDDLVIGNIHENSLQEIYFGENMKRVRESFLKRKHLPTCIDCSRYVPVVKEGLRIQNE